jgi:hypothetical protein
MVEELRGFLNSDGDIEIPKGVVVHVIWEDVGSERPVLSHKVCQTDSVDT